MALLALAWNECPEFVASVLLQTSKPNRVGFGVLRINPKKINYQVLNSFFDFTDLAKETCPAVECHPWAVAEAAQ